MTPDQSTPKSGAAKRPGNAAALSDVTNLLLPVMPTPIKPRRAGRPQPSSTCSSSALLQGATAGKPVVSSAPCHEAKKSSSTPELPEDFVKKQRAYFADIDAFELPEEEVLGN